MFNYNQTEQNLFSAFVCYVLHVVYNDNALAVHATWWSMMMTK